jgi:hypothetical protein
MLARRIFVLLLATILIGRTLHCCYTSAVLCAGAVRADDSSGAPLTDPADMDPNESGCICKGAIVNAPTVLDLWRAAANELDSLAAALPPADVASPVLQVQAGPADRHVLGPPPLGGRALRAWLGSLLV